MMRALTLICVLACLSIQDAHARLFETEREVLARYGGIAKKLKAGPGEEMFVYQQGDFFVVVAFVNGKSAMEVYGHRDGKTPLSTKEMRSFLDLNSFGQHWRKSPDIPLWSLGGWNPRSWTALAACYPKSPHTAPGLGVMTFSYARKLGIAP